MKNLTHLFVFFILTNAAAFACDTRERAMSETLSKWFAPVPPCFADQKKKLTEFGFETKFKSDELRIFVLMRLMRGEYTLDRGLRLLGQTSDPRLIALRKELVEMKYAFIDRHDNVRTFKPSEDVVTFLSQIGGGGDYCRTNNKKDPVCIIEEQMDWNRKEFSTYLAKQWTKIKNVSPGSIRTNSGKIPDAPAGTREANDFAATEIAHEIFEMGKSSDYTPSDWERIRALNQIYETTSAQFYTGRNQAAKDMMVITKGFWGSSYWFLDMVSLDKVVRDRMVTARGSHFRGGNDLSDITAETSKSPLLSLFGEGSRRVTHWPWDVFDDPMEVGTGNFRYSEIFDKNGVLQAIEVIARDFYKSRMGIRVDEYWEPFLYEQRWGKWFPVHKVKDVPVKDFCMSCHISSRGQFSPLPNNADTAEELKTVGYKDINAWGGNLIENLLRFKN